MEFVISNDLILEKIIGYLPNEDILKARRVCRQWYSIVDNIMIKTHHPLIGLNVIDDFTPEFSTDLQALLWSQERTRVLKKMISTNQSPHNLCQRIFGNSICPLFLLIFGNAKDFNLKRCQTVDIGCDARIFCDQISSQDVNSFYGGSDFTTELMACLLFPRFYSDLKVTVTDWGRGDSLEPSFDYPHEPVKGILVFYTDIHALIRASHLLQFMEEKANIKDKILINGPARWIQYFREPNDLGIPEETSVLSIAFSGERVKVAMFSHEFSENDEISFKKKLTEFKESLEFDTESDIRDQLTFGLVFMHGNPSFDPRCYLKSLFPKVAFIESALKRWPGTSYLYSEVIAKVIEDPPSCLDPLQAENERNYERFNYAKYNIGKISLVIINLKRRSMRA